MLPILNYMLLHLPLFLVASQFSIFSETQTGRWAGGSETEIKLTITAVIANTN